jgi:hypothetical protein
MSEKTARCLQREGSVCVASSSRKTGRASKGVDGSLLGKLRHDSTVIEEARGRSILVNQLFGCLFELPAIVKNAVSFFLQKKKKIKKRERKGKGKITFGKVFKKKNQTRHFIGQKR